MSEQTNDQNEQRDTAGSATDPLRATPQSDTPSGGSEERHQREHIAETGEPDRDENGYQDGAS